MKGIDKVSLEFREGEMVLYLDEIWVGLQWKQCLSWALKMRNSDNSLNPMPAMFMAWVQNLEF